MRSRIIITFDPPGAGQALAAAASAIVAAGVKPANVKIEQEAGWIATWEPSFDRMIAGDLFARYVVNDKAKLLLELMSTAQVLVRFGGVPGRYHSVEAAVKFRFAKTWLPDDLNYLGYRHDGGVDAIGRLVEQFCEDNAAAGGPPIAPHLVSVDSLVSWVQSFA